MYLIYEGLINKARKAYFRKISRKYMKNSSSYTILDYGCGPGDMLLLCKNQGIQAVGVDLSQRSVELAKERGLKVYQANWDNLPFEEESFDFIFMQSVIEHMIDPIDAMNELKKYLKYGGILFISAPTPCSEFWNDPTHVRPFTPKSFKIISDICGLNLKEVNYVFSFLLNIKLKSSFIYKILNFIPYSLGSNIIGVYEKVDNSGEK